MKAGPFAIDQNNDTVIHPKKVRPVVLLRGGG